MNFLIPQGHSVDPIECYDGLRVAGQERSPLQKLACRILAICANSASVERLFSLFGHILTKLRSRLRTEAMVQLAELKLHIRDEYTKNTHAKQRLKRHIAGAPRSTAVHSTASASPAAPTPTLPLSHSTQTAGEGEREDSASSAGPVAEGSLQAIADRLISMANEDCDENGEDEPFPSTLSFTLADLFDFSDNYWVKSSEATGNRGLQDELDLYELVDLDASGELDTDIDVDGMAEAVLTSQ
jgi:hypothetical protein